MVITVHGCNVMSQCTDLFLFFCSSSSNVNQDKVRKVKDGTILKGTYPELIMRRRVQRAFHGPTLLVLFVEPGKAPVIDWLLRCWHTLFRLVSYRHNLGINITTKKNKAKYLGLGDNDSDNQGPEYLKQKGSEISRNVDLKWTFPDLGEFWGSMYVRCLPGHRLVVFMLAVYAIGPQCWSLSITNNYSGQNTKDSD